MIDQLNQIALFLWQSRQARQAKQLFHTFVSRDCVSLRDTAIARYMLAYIDSELVATQQDPLCIMGIDLKQDYRNPYLNAARHLIALRHFDFHPAEIGLPIFPSITLVKIALAHQQAAQLVLSHPILKSLLNSADHAWLIEMHPHYQEPFQFAFAKD
jgi:hypothetical protein